MNKSCTLADVHRFPDAVAFFCPKAGICELKRPWLVVIIERAATGDDKRLSSIKSLAISLGFLVLELHIVALRQGFDRFCIRWQIA